MRMVVFAALLAAAAPAGAQEFKPAKPAAAGKAQPKAKAEPDKKKDDFDMAKAMAVFDKIFPAQPDPAPERLALARATANGMLPDGTYAGLFDDMISGLVERVLSLNPAEFGAPAAKDKAPAAMSLRQEIAKGDPHFEERMRITRRVIGEELIKISAVMEPKLREGLARSIARRFDERQLKDVNAFLATDTGKAFAGQTMRMWVDPDVMRSMVQGFPHMVSAMPGAMMRLEAETAHLPKPKKEPAPAKDADEEEVEASDS